MERCECQISESDKVIWDCEKARGIVGLNDQGMDKKGDVHGTSTDRGQARSNISRREYAIWTRNEFMGVGCTKKSKENSGWDQGVHRGR